MFVGGGGVLCLWEGGGAGSCVCGKGGGGERSCVTTMP